MTVAIALLLSACSEPAIPSPAVGGALRGRKLLDAGEFPPRDATVIPDH